MKRLTLAAALATAAGCATEPPRLEENVTYLAEWVGDEAVIGRRPLSLTLSEGRAYGNTGCNHWFAQYTLNGQALRFDAVGSTRRACDAELAEQERHFLALLGEVRRWDVSQIDQLQLWPAEGAPLRFWPAQD